MPSSEVKKRRSMEPTLNQIFDAPAYAIGRDIKKDPAAPNP
jgi:hypothetical protein